MSNEEGIDRSKLATKFNFKRYDTVFDYVVRFGKTCGIEGKTLCFNCRRYSMC